MKEPAGKKSYTEEFKKEVVHTALMAGTSLSEIARMYKINLTLVRNWKAKYEAEILQDINGNKINNRDTKDDTPTPTAIWHIDRAKFVFSDPAEYKQWKKEKKVFFEFSPTGADDGGDVVFADADAATEDFEVTKDRGLMKITLENDGPVISAWVGVLAETVDDLDQETLTDWSNDQGGWSSSSIYLGDFDVSIVEDDGGDWRLVETENDKEVSTPTLNQNKNGTTDLESQVVNVCKITFGILEDGEGRPNGFCGIDDFLNTISVVGFLNENDEWSGFAISSGEMNMIVDNCDIGSLDGASLRDALPLNFKDLWNVVLLASIDLDEIEEEEFNFKIFYRDDEADDDLRPFPIKSAFKASTRSPYHLFVHKVSGQFEFSDDAEEWLDVNEFLSGGLTAPAVVSANSLGYISEFDVNSETLCVVPLKRNFETL